MTGQSLNATPGKIRVASLAVAILAAAMLALAVTGDALAQSSLGIGTNDAMPVSTGLFARQLAWINLKQQEFYRALAGAMKAMRQDDSKLWVLLGLSFLYGVFHAAGPGHGKAVISAYMVANECALRRGILLSFVSALLQAFTAIALMLVAFLVLRGAAISMTDAAWFLEIASYVFITGFGAWLLWKKASPALLAAFRRPPVYSLPAAGADALHSASPQGGRTTRRARLSHPAASPTPRPSRAPGAAAALGRGLSAALQRRSRRRHGVRELRAQPRRRPVHDLGRAARPECCLGSGYGSGNTPLFRRIDRPVLCLPQWPLAGRRPVGSRHGAWNGHHRGDTGNACRHGEGLGSGARRRRALGRPHSRRRRDRWRRPRLPVRPAAAFGQPSRRIARGVSWTVLFFHPRYAPG